MNTTSGTISAAQTLDHIGRLIESGAGDPGRLRYIYEFIQRGRSLYRSDLRYLEKKIRARIVFEAPRRPSEREELAGTIQRLLRLRIGYAERLQFMLGRIKSGKPLFESDRMYLEGKMRQIPDGPKYGRRPAMIRPKARGFAVGHAAADRQEGAAGGEAVRWSQEISESKKAIEQLQSRLAGRDREIAEKDAQIRNLVEQYSRILSDTALGRLENDELKQRILDETKRIDGHKLVSEQLAIQRERLAKLTAQRAEQEGRISREQEALDGQERLEAQKAAENDRLVQELAKKQDHLENAIMERDEMLMRIKKEQDKLEREILRQREGLERARKEYDELSDQSRDD